MKFLTHSKRILAGLLLVLHSLPSLHAECSRCTTLTTFLTNKAEVKFTPSVPKAVCSGIRGPGDVGSRTCYNLVKGKIYTIQLKAKNLSTEPTFRGPCMPVSSVLTLKPAGGILFMRPHTNDSNAGWHLACQPCGGSTTMTASNYPAWSDSCLSTNGCEHEGCTHQAGCQQCDCYNPGEQKQNEYHTAYWQWQEYSGVVHVDEYESNKAQLEESVGPELDVSLPNDAGMMTVRHKDIHNMIEIPWDERTKGTPSSDKDGNDRFERWTSSLIQVSERVGAKECLCYRPAVDTHQDTIAYQDILIWVQDDDESNDAGNGTTNMTDVPVSTGGGGEISTTQFSIHLGLGRNSSGEAVGQLSVTGWTDASNLNYMGLQMNDPFGKRELQVQYPAPAGVARRWQSNTLRVDERHPNANTFEVVFTRRSDNVEIARHTMISAVYSALPGIIYTQVRKINGVNETKVWELYGMTGSTGERLWRTVEPDGRIVDGAETPRVFRPLPDKPGQTSQYQDWAVQVDEYQRTGGSVFPISTKVDTFVGWWNAVFLMDSTMYLKRGSGVPDEVLKTAYEYYDDAEGAVVSERDIGKPYFTQLKSVVRPDGSWEYHVYDETDGHLVRSFSPWLGEVTDPADATLDNSRCVTRQVIAGEPESWEIESIAGTVVSRVWKREWTDDIDPTASATRWSDPDRRGVDPASYYTQLLNDVHWENMAKDPSGTGTGTGTSLSYQPVQPPSINLDGFSGTYNIAMRQRFSADYNLWEGSMVLKRGIDEGSLSDPVSRSVNSNGLVTAYEYQKGRYDSINHTIDWTQTSGSAVRVKTLQYAMDPETLVLLAQHPIVQEQDVDGLGLTVAERTKHGDSEVSSTTHEYDWNSRQRLRTMKDGIETYKWERHSPYEIDETDNEGSATRTTFSEGGESLFTTRLGHKGSAPVRSGMIQAGRTTINYTLVDSTPVMARVSSSTVDPAGRRIAEVDELGRTTFTAYAESGRVVTETLPGGLTRITENYLDGRLKTITGTAGVPEYHTYTVNDDGTLSETVYVNDTGAAGPRSPRWSRSTTNGLGWLMKEERPGPAGNVLTTVHSYNTKGQRIKTEQTGQADTLYVYDHFGKLVVQGQDYNDNGKLDAESMDPMTVTQVDYQEAGGRWYEVTTTAFFTSETSTAPSLVAQRVYRTLGGTNDISVVQSSDGTQTTTATTRNPAQKRVTTTTISNRGGLPVVKIKENGQLISETSRASSTPTLYTYDDLGRQRTWKDATGITWEVTYDDLPLGSTSAVGSTLIFSDRIKTRSIKPVGAIAFTLEASYVYDPVTGQTLRETNAAGESTYYDYNSQGQVIRQRGDRGYPVAYGYSAYGELIYLGTFRSVPTGASFMPADGDLTTWRYDAASGMLLGKKDAASKEVTYAYDEGGRLHTRKWAREVVTTYGYDPVGRLTQVLYGDNTPDVTHTYHRDGSLASTTDAAGTHTYSPRPLGTTTAEETLVWHADYYGTKAAKIVNNLDGQGLRTGWKLQTGADLQTLTTMSQVNYSYTPGGDLAMVSGAGMTWSYDYVSGTSLIDRITAAGTGLKTVTLQRSYDSRRRVSSLAYASDNVVRLGWNYGYDPQHPERRLKTASMINGLPGWAYNYNARGEVTGASRGTGDLSSLSSVEGQTWGYAYDAIGNRLSSTRGLTGDSHTGGVRRTEYQANALNQYVSITRPNALEVTGVTHQSVPRVSVNGQPTVGRPPGNGEPGGFALWLDGLAGGAADGQWPQVTLQVEQPGAAQDDPPLSYSRTGRTLVRPSEESVYDDDGNLEADGTWLYQWDGENRLTMALMKENGVPLDVPLQMVSFRYDAQGRRVSKAIFQRRTPATPGASRPSGWSLMDVVLFYYDGWNLMAEVSMTASESSRRYFWGTDLSGTLQGAGGVGGLLGIAGLTGQVEHLPCTEVNGNIMGLIGAVSGELVTRWDYDAFGNVVTDWVKPGSAGAGAKSPFKFSTKYLDEETGLVYYGYRYYQPADGRWLGRDPIAEDGGANLYGFCGNDSIDWIDGTGLKALPGGGPRRAPSPTTSPTASPRQSPGRLPRGGLLPMLARELMTPPEPKTQWQDALITQFEAASGYQAGSICKKLAGKYGHHIFYSPASWYRATGVFAILSRMEKGARPKEAIKPPGYSAALHYKLGSVQKGHLLPFSAGGGGDYTNIITQQTGHNTHVYHVEKDIQSKLQEAGGCSVCVMILPTYRANMPAPFGIVYASVAASGSVTNNTYGSNFFKLPKIYGHLDHDGFPWAMTTGLYALSPWQLIYHLN